MDKNVVEKCLAFCQALTNSNKQFSFCLTMGSDTLNFSSEGLDKSPSGRKKKSPSQLRREERRKEDRKRAATEAHEDAAKVSDQLTSVVKPKCNHCDTAEDSEEELKAHIESAHKPTSSPLPSPEKERLHSGGASCCELQMSPIQLQRSEMQISEREGAGFPLQEVGTQMCPACDFDMCFPNLDYLDISCKCFLGEDS